MGSANKARLPNIMRQCNHARMACCYESNAYNRETQGCQFQSLPDEVIAALGDLHRGYEFDGKTWCAFHLPLEAENGALSAKEAMSCEWVDRFSAAVHKLIDLARDSRSTCDLTGTVFPGPIHFLAAIFPEIWFTGTVFKGDVFFRATEFKGLASFEHSRFIDSVCFVHVIFAGFVSFTGANFGGIADFAGAVFRSDPDIPWQLFTQDSLLPGLWDVGPALFNKVTFQSDADFSSHGNFDGVEQAEQNTFNRFSFEGAIFDGEAIFTNRRFLAPADFRVRKFAKAPDFHGCAIHEGTLFPDCRDVFKDVSGDHAALAYSTLKNAMAGFKRVDDEAMFYALELESKLNGDKSPAAVKWAIRLYKWTADYGQSFVRPLWRFLEVFGFALVAYFFVDQIVMNGGPPGSSLTLAITLALEQIFRPFAIWGAAAPVEILDYPWGWQILLKLAASIQSAVSLGLIALSLFALRWRFKRP